jgi:hypothetical protein
MKKLKTLLLSVGIIGVLSFTASSQETMMKKVEGATKAVARKTVSGTKAVYRGGKRVGYTVGNKTWDGSRWVASKSWKGGKWVAVKTVNGTKWVYRKGRNAVTGTRKRIP